ncbi:MAG: hypothetical protein AB7I27_11220 [Bacteriovoracaceae bacterium]
MLEEIAESLRKLRMECRFKSESEYSLKSKVLLDTMADVLEGLEHAINDFYEQAIPENDDDGIVSPKSIEPWD